MPNRHRFVTATACLLALAATAAAQNCYDSQHQCFTFGPTPEADVGKIDTDGALELRSAKLSIEGDIRLRLRTGDTRSNHAYNGTADQQATRARVRMRYQANEHVYALAELNFAETWAGSESYSDALAGEDFNGLSQFYVDADDMLGFGDHWRIGRSEYILGNGLILGSCDFLQRPGTFTGAWFSRAFGPHHVELFVFDDYGPLQAEHPGVRYIGGTGKIDLDEPTGGLLAAVSPYFMMGTDDGDEIPTTSNRTEDDAWAGLDAKGTLPEAITWHGEYAHRFVDGAEDRTGWRVGIAKKVGWFDGVLDTLSLDHTDADGKLDVGNPADFNTAGLLHQYGGAWRSDMQTTQLGIGLAPGLDTDVFVNLLAMDRRGTSTQLGEYEADLVVRRKFASGVFVSAGYGVDDDVRQVGYFQLTLNF